MHLNLKFNGLSNMSFYLLERIKRLEFGIDTFDSTLDVTRSFDFTRILCNL